jgi:hypothetical protein
VVPETRLSESACKDARLSELVIRVLETVVAARTQAFLRALGNLYLYGLTSVSTIAAI